MENTVYIWTPEEVPEMDAFSCCDEIEQPNICDLCEENEAFVSVVFKHGERLVTEHACVECYCSINYQRLIKKPNFVSVKQIKEL
jgi:uncharacterized protein (DUF924 family)